MLNPKDPEYIQSRLIKLGEKTMDGRFMEFAKWVNTNYKSQILNIRVDSLSQNCSRLQLIFERENTLEQFFIKDRFTIASYKKTKIVKKFRALFNVNNSEEIILIINAFERIAKQDANTKVPEEIIAKLKEKHKKNIWEISRFGAYVTFFFYTKKELIHAMHSGLTTSLKEEYLKLLAPFDEFGYFTLENLTAVFDTKESFDNNYASSWHAYYR